MTEKDVMDLIERTVRLDTGTLRVRARESAFALDELCGFAARHNRKRGFLFLSKVLGKHWPVTPTRMREIHTHLAGRLDLGAGPCLFVAMAETATGLGQGVFESVLEQRPETEALFIHSTRYRIDGRTALDFQEAHCHAPDQLLYAPIRPELRARFESARELVLIDDEISTGNTLCNLVESYRRLNPDIERVHFVAITQFGGADSAARFSDRLGLPVECVAALHGEFAFDPAASCSTDEPPPAVGDNRRAPHQLAEDLGRFGIERSIVVPNADLERLSEGLESGDRILVLGTGEFMHLAFRVGLGLEALGFQVAVQATSRSPILLGADVGSRRVFADNYGEGICNYLYNVDPDDYARIIVCHETPRAGLDDLLQNLGPHHRSYSVASTE
ncbi:MAG: phosphoribosyltransferase family protein [Chromatiales bacterium]|nr:phosphoribosyltransferase family protein [Chromatiales bacterium]